MNHRDDGVSRRSALLTAGVAALDALDACADEAALASWGAWGTPPPRTLGT